MQVCKKLSILGLLLLVFTIAPWFASSAYGAESGEWCDGITYTIDDDNVLTISGSGTVEYSDDFSWGYGDFSKLVIEEGITDIADEVFAGLQFSGDLVIPASVKSIGYYAFGENNLESLSFADGSVLESIGECAFQDCSGLVAIKGGFPSSLQLIDGWAFDGTALSGTIALPSNCKVGEAAFPDNVDFGEPLTLEGTLDCGVSWEYDPDTKTMTFTGSEESDYDSLVTDMRDKLVFAADASLETKGSLSDVVKIVFGEGFTEIPIGFAQQLRNGPGVLDWSSLESVVIGKDVTTIGDGAFMYCTKLSEVTIEEGSSLSTINTAAFSQCASLKELDLSATKITEFLRDSTTNHARQFSYSGLEKITLPECLEYVDTNVFEGCTSLVKVTMPDSTKTIKAGAFNGCTSLQTLYVPATLELFESNSPADWLINGGESKTNLVVHGSMNGDLKVFKQVKNRIRNTSFKNARESLASSGGCRCLDFFFHVV